MSSPLPRWLILLVIAGIALWLRTVDLGKRPMHADEANQAVKLGNLIESGHYAFDPRDHHGPTLYYAALPIAWLRGETTLARLSETTVRLVPALAGTLAVLLLYALAQPLGFGPALLAAAFLAVSPPAVYYSRYFIQETLLTTFTLGAMVCGQRWWRRGHLTWAIAAGIFVGLMQATKASAPLFAGAAIIALVLIRPLKPSTIRVGRDAICAAATALAVAALFYSSFGKNPSGLHDALSVYGPAWRRVSDGAGHEKPWWYYLQIFGWQKNGGLVWQQLAFLILTLGGLILAWARRQTFFRWNAVYTVSVAMALSVVPYKTPWHVIHLVPGMAILAAGAAFAFHRWSVRALIAIVTLATLLTQTCLAAYTFPADNRNPYAYVHSSPDVLKFRSLAEAALARSPEGIVRVVGEEYWPLPWYLRGLPRVGYWSAPPVNCDGALVITTMTQTAAVRARLHGDYRENYLGLRPGVICIVFTPRQ